MTYTIELDKVERILVDTGFIKITVCLILK